MSELITVSTVNKEVYEQLRQQIRTGKIRPGSKITIREIAARFGVSTMPVREAIRRLQAEGFLSVETRSVTVNKLSLNEVKQLFVIRQRLESLAIEWCLQNLDDNHAEEIKELEEILEEMDNKEISYNDWQRLNRTFHLTMYKLANSPSLQQLIENVWDKVTPYMFIYSSTINSFEESQKQHYLMLDYLIRKDKELLIDLLVEHLKDTYNAIQKGLEESNR